MVEVEKMFWHEAYTKDRQIGLWDAVIDVADILLHHVAQAKIRNNVCIGTIWVPICEMK
jgi:hypothetical protein